MAKKSSLQRHLQANPMAKQHERVIKETIKALQQLRESGFVETGYDLGSPYGGNRDPQDLTSRKMAPGGKMTYCA